jgi:hypothetical protein
MDCTRPGARRARLRDGARQAAWRICLHCGKRFRSQSPHNRICPQCANAPVFRMQVISFEVQVGQGGRGDGD